MTDDRGITALLPTSRSLLGVLALAVLVSCTGTDDQGLARMVEWSDGCCRPAWRCAIAALEGSSLGREASLELSPPDEPYRSGARQDFMVETPTRRGTVAWTEHSVSYRFLGEQVSVPLPCQPEEVGPLP